MKKIFFIGALVSIFLSCENDQTEYGPTVITDFTPKSGPPGTTIVITGYNFDRYGRNQAWFGTREQGWSADPIEHSSTRLTLKVPQDAVTSRIWVQSFHSDQEWFASTDIDFEVTN